MYTKVEYGRQSYTNVGVVSVWVITCPCGLVVVVRAAAAMMTVSLTAFLLEHTNAAEPKWSTSITLHLGTLEYQNDYPIEYMT